MFTGWREVDGTKHRQDGKLQLLDDLFSNIKSARPAEASEIKGNLSNCDVHKSFVNSVKAAIVQILIEEMMSQ